MYKYEVSEQDLANSKENAVKKESLAVPPSDDLSFKAVACVAQ